MAVGLGMASGLGMAGRCCHVLGWQPIWVDRQHYASALQCLQAWQQTRLLAKQSASLPGGSGKRQWTAAAAALGSNATTAGAALVGWHNLYLTLQTQRPVQRWQTLQAMSLPRVTALVKDLVSMVCRM